MKKTLLLLLAACSSNEPEASTQKPVDEAVATAANKAAEVPDDLPMLADLAKNGPTKDKFPQADAYVALDHRDIVVQPDHTVVETHHTIVRLLDAQRGKEKFADLHIRFDSKQQTLAVTVARTVGQDGVPHAARPEEIGDIVPPELADATTYSSVRERVVSFPAVDMGSVLELVYTRTTKPSPDAPLGGEVVLGAWDPVKELSVSITAPEGVKLAVAGAQLTPKTSGATTTYTLTDLPDRHPEMGAPPEESVMPRLVYGFQADWQAAVAPVASRFDLTPTPAIKAAADQAVAGAIDEQDKAKKLFAYVAQNIRPIELPLGAAGYAPHPLDEVLANKYADGRDKVALLLAMAASQGITGKPVFVRTNHVQVQPDVPTLAQFDRVLAKLTIGGKDVWLDPEPEASQYGVAFAGQDNLVLPIDRGGELGKRPALEPSTSASHTIAHFALSATGDLDATYDYDLSGMYAVGAIDELRPLQGENLERFFRRGAARLSAAALDKDHAVGDLATGQGLKMAQHVTVSQYAQSQSNYRVVELPPATMSFASDLPPADLGTRKYPLFVGTPRTETADVSIDVPTGWKVAYVPPALTGSSDGIKYVDKCDATDRSVTCHTEITLDHVEVPVEQYAGFHDAFAKLRAYERRIVVLAKA